ncbi:MAG: TolC family protein [Candidatus Eremiobacteraeota bacterium]|nr:TolC family protein [Candidatus Eremiobacteraeota bacterium]MCW5872101.1 TolC family protein [Candidatus Eremiobacteraeota bacterium]
MKRLLLLLALTGGVSAQEPLRLTLSQALQLAERGNPELHLSEQGIDVARGNLTIAGQRPNPTVGINTPIGPAERKQALLFVIPLETGGRREARLAVAESTVTEADLTRRQMQMTVRNGTRNAFVELAMARAALEQSKRDVEFNDRVVSAAQKRFEAGEIAEAEVIRAKFEREQIVRLQYPAENRVEAAQVSFNRLLGQDLQTPIETVEEGWLFPTPEDLAGPTWQLPELAHLREIARQQRPDVALSQQQSQTAVRQVQLALANQAPAVSLQGSLLYNPAMPAFTYLAGVMVEVPFGSDRGGEVEQARAREEEAARRQQVALATVDQAVVLAWNKFQAARRQFSHDLEVLKPQAERVLYLAERIYGIGQSDITEVLLVGQSVQRQRQLLLADLTQLHQALGELELAVNSSLVGGKP